jgi:hypothetical protein
MLKITQIREAEDLSPDIDVLFGEDPEMSQLSLVRALNGSLKPTHYKHEWQDDALQSEIVTIPTGTTGDWDTKTATTGMPMAAGDVAKLKIGDIIQLNVGNEQVRVTAVGTTSIEVTRGVGGTATAQGGTAQTGYVIGNAQEDGSDPVEPAMTVPTERYNYVQTFENPYHVSQLLNHLKVSNVAEFVRQRRLALKSLISKLDMTMLLGVRYQSGAIHMMNGLRAVASNTANLSGTITKEKLYLAIIDMIKAGGNPDQIHAGHTMIGWIEQLCSADGYERVPMKNAAQFTVKSIDILGVKLELHANRHMDVPYFDGQAFILDSSKIKFGAIRDFAPYEVDSNGKQMKEHIVGDYTMEVRNPASSICRAYGGTGI